MTSPAQPEDSRTSTTWHFLSGWWVIFVVSAVLLMLTLNPLLAGFLPYLRAGWPAARTAFWLKSADSWKARGTVGLLFHLCMALFRAGGSGFLSIVVTVIVAEVTHEQPDLILFAIAVLTIVFGCFLSTILSCFGAVIAVRHGVRIFVSSHLCKICHGDFTEARTLELGSVRTNPGNYILAVATATPMLTIWFVAMLMTMPGPMEKDDNIASFIILCLLPILGSLCIAIVIFLSRRIMAHSPVECWGAEAPESETRAASLSDSW